WWQAGVHNISGHGVGLLSTYHLEVGTLLAVDLEGASRLLLARVTHVTPHAEDWLVGCEFVSKLSTEELGIFV
ncbi:MAG: PilZ domain-containing protein, partial [Gemmataceae bacterium]|nr:PilZ domain-containing protein [Gemmataceae bacterium]